MTPAPRPTIDVSGRKLGGGQLFLIAGPCVLESRELTLSIAEKLVAIASERKVPLVFKASFDKANRSSARSGRGPGLGAIEWLGEVRERFGVPVLTDVHQPDQCASAAEIVDVLQIPAFLCRQTDLLVAAAQTGRAMNVKKGQFLAPWDMKNVVQKCEEAGNKNVLVTERGSSFGFGRLVVDMTGFDHLARTERPVVFDATHSVQEPGALGDRSGGDRTKVPALARAAVATGQVDGLFFEVHPDPARSPSDGPNMIRLADFPGVLDGVLAIHRAVRALD
jgi:2-dehydro-3-deoxyphosphooctonate aldolase (KDO 8-P synthase)